METKIVNLKVVVSGDTDVKQLEKDINKVVDANKKLETTSKKAGSSTTDALEGASGAADNLGGGISGVVEQFKVVSVAAKKGGKAMRSALISTGVGALVVALGLVVEYWEEIGEFLGFINKDLERQHELLTQNIGLLDAELGYLKQQEKFNKERNISNEENLKKQKEILLQKQKLIAEDIKILEAQLLKEESVAKEASLYEKIIAGFAGRKPIKIIDSEERERLNEIRKQILALKTEAVITDGLLDTESIVKPTKGREKERESTLDGITGEDRARQIEQKQQLFEELFEIEKMQKDALAELGTEALNEALHNEDVLAAVQEENRRKTLVQTKILRAQEVQYAKEGLNAISTVLGQSSAAGKAVAISSALINTYQGISAELATKTATPFEFGLKIANIASVVSIGFKAVKDIVATKLPNFANNSGGGGGSGGGQSAPSFNVVGNSGASQIAQTLNQEQEPIQAYVVASNVTSAQEVNRNIIETATIG